MCGSELPDELDVRGEIFGVNRLIDWGHSPLSWTRLKGAAVRFAAFANSTLPATELHRLAGETPIASPGPYGWLGNC
jgi:hypothetical protein